MNIKEHIINFCGWVSRACQELLFLGLDWITTIIVVIGTKLHMF